MDLICISKVGAEWAGQFNFSTGFQNFCNLIFLNGFKNVQNVIQIALKQLFFSRKIKKIAQRLRASLLDHVCDRLELHHFEAFFKRKNVNFWFKPLPPV